MFFSKLVNQKLCLHQLSWLLVVMLAKVVYGRSHQSFAAKNSCLQLQETRLTSQK